MRRGEEMKEDEGKWRERKGEGKGGKGREGKEKGER